MTTLPKMVDILFLYCIFQ